MILVYFMAHSVSGNINEVAYVSPVLAVANISYPFLPVELYSFLLYLQVEKIWEGLRKILNVRCNANALL